MENIAHLQQPDLFEMILRLSIAVISGSLVGVERYLRGHPAGMRTFALVSLTSALLTASLGFGPYGSLMGATDNGGSRVVQGILAGIGFIGAGVIVRDALSVRGLTSAASLWAVAAIGILVGTGEALLGLLGSIMVLIVLVFFRKLDQLLPRRAYTVIALKFDKKAVFDEELFKKRLEEFGFKVTSVSFRGAKSGSIQVKANVWASGKSASEARSKLVISFRDDVEITEFSVEPVAG